MKRFTFLPTELVYSFLLLWIYALWNCSLGPKVLTSIFLILIFYICRRTSIPLRDTAKLDCEIFLSPVHGIVE